MKKSLFLIIIFFLIISSYSVLSQTTENTTNPAIPKIDTKDPTPKLDEKIEREITIPNSLHLITKVGLGINPQEKIQLSTLIITIAIWVMILIVAVSGLKTIPSLSIMGAWVSAIAITMIIGSTKAISIATEKWLETEELFVFINQWSFGKFMLNIIVIIIVIVIALYVSEKMKKESEEDKKESGLDAIKNWFSTLKYQLKNSP